MPLRLLTQPAEVARIVRHMAHGEYNGASLPPFMFSIMRVIVEELANTHNRGDLQSKTNSMFEKRFNQFSKMRLFLVILEVFIVVQNPMRN